MTLPTENEVDKALKYLASTDESEANAKGRVKGLEEKKKLILALEFDSASGSAAERMKKAECSLAYAEYVTEYENAVADHRLLENKRKRAELTIEVWRSTNANRRKGNV